MSDEKDRFGNKLRDKEHAEEARYFAEQDRQRLEKLRTQPKEAGATQLGLCPRCGIPLNRRDLHGDSIDECSRCHGIWLDKGQLEAVVEHEDEGWARRWLRNVLSGSHR
jgi:hypothetical protein